LGTINSTGRSHSCSHFSPPKIHLFKIVAHLIKREGSPYWIAAFDVTMPDGTVRRLKKSTKKTKRDAAMEEALRLEALAKKEHTADQDTASKAYAT
jgi:hypothetical protein